ncbi:TonB-dependent receptor, partial [Phascolarctobacterium succinatutens]
SLDGIMTDNVEKIEILKGASSVLYGAEAFGGVVNIITKKGGAEKLRASVTAGNIGYRKYAASYTSDKASFSYSKQFFGAQERTSPNREDRGYYNDRSKGNKANYALSLNLTDKLNASFMRSEADSTYGQVTYNKSTVAANAAATKDYHYKDNKDSLSVTYDDKDSGFKSIFFFNDRDLYGETRNRSTYKYTENASNYKAYNVGLDTQKVWNLRNDKDSLLAGILVSRDKYKGTSAANNDVIADRENYALYAQYTYQATDKLKTVFGIREQIIEDMVKDQKVFLPQFQALYKVEDNSSWYMNIGRAFQMPALSDTFKKSGAMYQQVSGKNLKPQDGWNYETGYKIINDNNSWKFSLYYMDFKNMFGWEKENGQDIRVNKGKFKNVGFEADYTSILSDKFKANVGFSWSNPKNQATSSSQWEQTYPKIQFNTGVNYTVGKWDSSLALNWLTKRLKNRDGGTNPDLINLNAVVNYNMDENNYFTLNMNNILDRHNVITNGSFEYWDLPYNWTISYNHTF